MGQLKFYRNQYDKLADPEEMKYVEFNVIVEDAESEEYMIPANVMSSEVDDED